MGEPGTEEFYLNEEVQILMDQMWRATQRRVMKRRTLTMGFHHGRLQVLPPTLIYNWHVGNNRDKILPSEPLSAFNVSHLGTRVKWNAGKSKLRQMRCVMATLEKYARKENCYLSDKYLWTSEYTKMMREKIGEKYLISKFGGQNRITEMS